MGDQRQGSRCLLPEKAQPRDGGFELGRGFRYHARYARHGGGVFLLRIEDTDLERSRGEYILSLMEDMHWLGLDWQEGPEADATHGPYAQSQRGDIYRRYFDALEEPGLGYLPLAVVNYLARLGQQYENNAYLDMDGLAREFEVAKLGRAPARYDATQLDYWQRQAVQHADAETLWQWMGEAVQAIVPSAQRDAFVAAVRGNVLFPGDALRWARVIYTETLELQGAAEALVTQAGAAFFSAAAAAVEAHAADYAAIVEQLKRDTGAKGKALFKPLRAALTGEVDGPELAPLLNLITAARARARLARWS